MDAHVEAVTVALTGAKAESLTEPDVESCPEAEAEAPYLLRYVSHIKYQKRDIRDRSGFR